MKILVLSDSHGNLTNMELAVERTNPNLIFHLGDCWRDGERLHEQFPDIPLEKFHYIGNSSLSGAYAMVLSDEARDKVHEVARNMTYLELSTTPGYMDEFVAACFIPHTNSAIFPNCKQEDIG